MKHNRICAACDFGASSGRAIKGVFDGRTISLDTVHRFENAVVSVFDVPYWDVLYLYRNMMEGLGKLSASMDVSKQVDSIGIDTWGVDFGVIDAQGRLKGNPLSYRDSENDKAMESFHKIISPDDMYNRTGIANMSLNTVYQIYKMKKCHMLSEGDRILMLPDLFAWLLTGETHTGKAAISTSQMFTQGMGCFDQDILRNLQVSENIFPNMIETNAVYGRLKNQELYFGNSVKVISVPGHDTVCAAAAAEEDCIFLSSGTWSLLGMVGKSPVINSGFMKGGYSGYSDGLERTITVRDIMGMYLINCCKKEWNIGNANLGFNEIIELASRAEPFQSFIDSNNPVFYDGQQMSRKITENASGKKRPETIGEIARCIFESLAFSYRTSIEQLESSAGKTFDKVMIVGGGGQNELLCQFVADAVGKVCYCGIPEATAAGNFIGQLIGLKEIKDMEEGRQVIKKSFPLRIYEPRDYKSWNEAYGSYLSILLMFR